jgi:hypothetical protein
MKLVSTSATEKFAKPLFAKLLFAKPLFERSFFANTTNNHASTDPCHFLTYPVDMDFRI